MSCMMLVKSGYGSLREVQSFDSKDFLDCLEYEHIQNTIQTIIYDEAN